MDTLSIRTPFDMCQAAGVVWPAKGGLMDLVSITDAAKYLKLTRQRVHQLINKKRIPALTIGQQKFINRVDLEAFAKEKNND